MATQLNTSSVIMLSLVAIVSVWAVSVDCTAIDLAPSKYYQPLIVTTFTEVPVTTITVTFTEVQVTTITVTSASTSIAVSTSRQTTTTERTTTTTNSVTTTSLTTTTVSRRAGPDLALALLWGLAGAGAVGVATVLYVGGKKAVIRTLQEKIRGCEESSEENLILDLENQVRPRNLKLEDVKQVADSIKDSRQLIGDLKELYKEARSENERNKITEEAVRRIKRNVDQVDAFLSLLSSIQTSVIRKVSLTDEQLLMASREMKLVQNDIEQIGDALKDLNYWLESSFLSLAKFRIVADGYRELAIGVGFAIEELQKTAGPSVFGMTDAIEKISAARDSVSDQLRKISKAAYESTAVPARPTPPAAPEAKFCIECGAKIQAEAHFCGSCGAKQSK